MRAGVGPAPRGDSLTAAVIVMLAVALLVVGLLTAMVVISQGNVRLWQ